jgi:hypothetical protein
MQVMVSKSKPNCNATLESTLYFEEQYTQKLIVFYFALGVS